MSSALRALRLFSAAVMGAALLFHTAQAQSAKVARDANSQRYAKVLIVSDSTNPNQLMTRGASLLDTAMGTPHATPAREKLFAGEA